MPGLIKRLDRLLISSKKLNEKEVHAILNYVSRFGSARKDQRKKDHQSDSENAYHTCMSPILRAGW